MRRIISPSVTVFPLLLDGQSRIGVRFWGFDDGMLQKIRGIDGRRWHQALSCWHLPYTPEVWQAFSATFADVEIKVLEADSVRARDGSGPPKAETAVGRPTVGSRAQPDRSPSVSDGLGMPPKKDWKKEDVVVPLVRVRKGTDYPVYYLLEVPYEWRERIKSIKGFWLAEQKLWRLPFNAAKKREIERVFAGNLLWETADEGAAAWGAKLGGALVKHAEELVKLEEDMTIRRMSWRTIKSYKHAFGGYLLFYNDTHPGTLSMEHIKRYLLHLITDRQISESYQNTIINAIKYYYEKVQGWAPQYIDVPRPKPTEQDPEILSKEEVRRLFAVLDNPKHLLILKLLYSAGLRVGEVCNLTLGDVHFDDLQLFVKGAKGKKDR